MACFVGTYHLFKSIIFRINLAHCKVLQFWFVNARQRRKGMLRSSMLFGTIDYVPIASGCIVYKIFYSR